MLSLYKISNEYQRLLDDDEQDFDPSVIDVIHDSLEEKAVNVAAFIKNLEAEHSAVCRAIEDMEKRVKIIKKKADNWAHYLKCNLESSGVLEIKRSPQFVIKIKKCPRSVLITNENLIPRDYFVTKETTTISKSKLLDDLKQGLYVDGATLHQNTKLEIK